MDNDVRLDYLILAAHPDDAEIFCGGSILKWKSLGYHVGVADLTRGEAGTSGTVAERDAEAATATKILGLDIRLNLNLPDGALADCREHQKPIVDLIRATRPRVLVAPWGPCRHPDHSAVHNLARSCYFYSGNGKFDSSHPIYRPERLIYHLEIQDTTVPSFVVDISDHFDDKMRALWSYSTQFYSPESGETGTYIGSKLFMDNLQARFTYYGTLIGTRYGEPYVLPEMMRMDDPLIMGVSPREQLSQ